MEKAKSDHAVTAAALMDAVNMTITPKQLNGWLESRHEGRLEFYKLLSVWASAIDEWADAKDQPPFIYDIVDPLADALLISIVTNADFNIDEWLSAVAEDL